MVDPGGSNGESRLDGLDQRPGPVGERVPADDQAPAALGELAPRGRIREVAFDGRPKIVAVMVGDDGPVELGVEPVDRVGQDERAAGQRVVDPVRDEPGPAHVRPGVVEDDGGRSVVAMEVVVLDVVAAQEPPVEAVLEPAPPVDRQVVVRRQQPVDDRAARPVVRDVQEGVARTVPAGSEPLRVRGLVEGGDRDASEAGHPLGERVGGDEGEVVRVVQLGAREVRVADLPQDVELGRPVLGADLAEEVDRGVVPRGSVGRPVVEEPDPGRVAGPLEGPLEHPPEVEVAPRPDVGPVRGADPDGQPPPPDPVDERPFEHGGGLATAKIGPEDRLAGRCLESGGILRVGGRDEVVRLRVDRLAPGLGQPENPDETARDGPDVEAGVGDDDDVGLGQEPGVGREVAGRRRDDPPVQTARRAVRQRRRRPAGDHDRQRPERPQVASGDHV